MAYDLETQFSFVALRAQGISFDRIAEQLNVSKKTLFGWAIRHRDMIHAQRSIRLDAIRDQLECTKEKRTELLNHNLKILVKELSSRNVRAMREQQLFNLILKYTHALRREEQTPDPFVETKELTKLYHALADEPDQDAPPENNLKNPNFFYSDQNPQKTR